jgi:hypothetical protein
MGFELKKMLSRPYNLNLDRILLPVTLDEQKELIRSKAQLGLVGKFPLSNQHTRTLPLPEASTYAREFANEISSEALVKEESCRRNLLHSPSSTS